VEIIANTLHEAQYIILITSRSFLLRLRNISDNRFRENQNAILRPLTFFFRKSHRLRDTVERCNRNGHEADKNMAHALPTHIHKIYKNFCFSTTTMFGKSTPQCYVIRALPAFQLLYLFRELRFKIWFFLKSFHRNPKFYFTRFCI
jgi:hypothetical protein